MNRKKPHALAPALLVLLVALAGCGQSTPVATTVPTTAPTTAPTLAPTMPAPTMTAPMAVVPETATMPYPTASGPIVGTSVPGGGPITSPPLRDITPIAPPDTSVVLTPDASRTVHVTSADNGRKAELVVGDTLVLDLTDGDYHWTVELSNPAVLAGSLRTPLPAGPATYKAAAPGDTILSATGLLPCHSATPPCEAPTRGFQLSIRVR